MRAFTYIDVAIQTFILCAAVILALITVIEGSIESIGMIAMYAAFFLGPWQMLSSVITSLVRWMFLKWRLIHLVSSMIYLALLSLLAAFEFLGGRESILITILAFAIPGALAVFYYDITIKSFKEVRSTGKLKR